MSHEHFQSVRVAGSGASWHGWESEITLEQSRDMATVLEHNGLENVRAVPLKGIEVKGEGENMETVTLDTGAIGLYDSRGLCLGIHGAETYNIHQPSDTLAPYWEIIQADGRFRFDFLARLREGKVWVANFALEVDEEIVSENHSVYLGVSSSFDGTRATTCDASTVRKVCMNTVKLSDSLASTVKTRFRHRRELPSGDVFRLQVENALKDVERYKGFAEMLAGFRMSKDAAVSFLKASIFEPKLIDAKDAKGEPVQVYSEPTTREANRIEALERAFETTLSEIGSDVTAWSVWNSITRFADHESTIRKTEGRAEMSESQIRYESNLYGSSAAFKADNASRIRELVGIAA